MDNCVRMTTQPRRYPLDPHVKTKIDKHMDDEEIVNL